MAPWREAAWGRKGGGGGGGAWGSPELLGIVWSAGGAKKLPSAASFTPTSLKAAQLIGNKMVDIKTRQWGHVTG